MSEPIKAGDLVMVLRAHCASAAAVELGAIRTVLSLNSGSAYMLQCRQCRGLYEAQPIAEVEKSGWHPLAWLKRIPPLGELEGEKRDEKLTEPA